MLTENKKIFKVKFRSRRKFQSVMHTTYQNNYQTKAVGKAINPSTKIDATFT